MSLSPTSSVPECQVSPSSSVLEPSDEVFLFPPAATRQRSSFSDSPSPRTGILKPGPASNGKVHGLPTGTLSPETDNTSIPELNYARKQVRHSIVSVDSTYDLSGLSLPLSPRKRCQQKVSVYLHTHVALIIVSSLAILDAVCVIGQLISDIIIMQEKLTFFEKIDEELTPELLSRLPEVNHTLHDKWNLHAILEVLLGRDEHTKGGHSPDAGQLSPQNSSDSSRAISCHSHGAASLRRFRRAAAPKVPGHEVDHGALYDATHAFHLGSMAILSLLLLETLLKVFAMGTRLKHHKLEVFDAFVVTISWCLDVALWEGIWAYPGSEAATFLMVLLPWRIIRIVNSFVLVIQEKEHVQLKIVKQRLRLAHRRSKEALDKASVYRHEAKAMAGMCRKLGASEQEIMACSPSGKAGRRGSVQSVLERAASLTFISTLSNMGSLPSLFDVGGSSSDDEDQDKRNQGGNMERKASLDFTLRSQNSESGDLKLEGHRGHENPTFVVTDTSSDNQQPEPGHRDQLAGAEKAERDRDILEQKDGKSVVDTGTTAVSENNGTRL